MFYVVNVNGRPFVFWSGIETMRAVADLLPGAWEMRPCILSQFYGIVVGEAV